MSRARDIIRDIQKQTGKSLQDFENETGIRRETLSRVANGNPRYPGDKLIPELEAYATRLGIALSQLPVSKSKSEYVREPDNDILPEVRGIVEEVKTQNTHAVRQQTIPQVPKQIQQPVAPKRTQQLLAIPTCAECGIQNVPLSRKVPDVNMGTAFIYVCAKCLKRPMTTQLRQQKQSTIPTQRTTIKKQIPWSEVFKKKEK